MTNNTVPTSGKSFFLKPWVLALITLGAIIIIALVVVGILETIKPVEHTKQNNDTTSDSSLMQSADSLKQKAFEKLNEGKSNEALDLFKQARDAYKAATPNATDEAPNNNVLDINVQIDMLENQTTPQQIENPGVEAR